MDKAWLDGLAEVVQEAGRLVEDIARQGFDTQFKHPEERRDPVTTADLACDAFLKERLLALLPEAGWLSEETKDRPDRLRKSWVWIVDPIDGTREFVRRIPEYAVSVALARDGEPVAGAVVNPATGDLFLGAVGLGAWRNGTPMACSRIRGERLTILGSRSEMNRGEFEPFAGVLDVRAVGSIAYKLALVAAGEADGTFSLGPKHEWDIAAGVALVLAAGGRVHDGAGRPFRFNQPHTLTRGIVAATREAYGDLALLLERHAPRRA
ncbi:3'(2'),5'-bisphosphate nucleotidase CysQ [Alicyclobacillus acidocaldarius]|uniref:inositol-phosphate phosphatase n=1 Tax=Alicyclobacillus acidocaldarius (strain Tc-4-1) TaxID=1048834 RepID=F8IHJ1_ALIAT|nr:3'(2'),5'-bisphosphate nucleotidase CysQ [Alicyclobacillus acidocaldarius]AEJ44464.1 inositol monophosphatase [Alicyclobacillus acidocaldarius subsp. acidocaldarius Tc-4-1]